MVHLRFQIPRAGDGLSDALAEQFPKAFSHAKRRLASCAFTQAKLRANLSERTRRLLCTRKAGLERLELRSFARLGVFPLELLEAHFQHHQRPAPIQKLVRRHIVHRLELVTVFGGSVLQRDEGVLSATLEAVVPLVFVAEEMF